MGSEQEWDAAVALEMQKGLTKAAATRAVVVNNPGLHARYLRDYNHARGHGVPESVLADAALADLPPAAQGGAKATAEATAQRAVDHWNGLVDAHARTHGVSRAIAVRAVAIADPEATTAYSAAVNSLNAIQFRAARQRG